MEKNDTPMTTTSKTPTKNWNARLFPGLTLIIILAWGTRFVTNPDQHVGRVILGLPPESVEVVCIEGAVDCDFQGNIIRIELSALPPSSNWQALEVSIRDHINLPPEIGQLTNLQELVLFNNQLTRTSLPPEIGQLSNLQELDLISNSLTSLPLESWQLHNLRRLYLGRNKLISLPPEIGQLSNLQELDLISNSLTSLPLESWQLRNLRRLYLGRNKLISLSPEIGQLTNLQELDLSHNHLTNLPSEIGLLTNLQELYINGNQLNSLPSEMGKLTSLQQFCLYDNPLTRLSSKLLAKLRHALIYSP
jgi:Leucine-rich repeat (LRR) protein